MPQYRITLNAANHSTDSPTLLTRRRAGFSEGFRRIKIALVPQSGVGQFPCLPLLQSREGRRNHSSVGGVKDYHNSRQLLRLLRQFRIIPFQNRLDELQSELRTRILAAVVILFYRNNLYIFFQQRLPVSREKRYLLT